MMARWLIPVVGLALSTGVALAADSGPTPAIAPAAPSAVAAPAAPAPAVAAPAPAAAPAASAAPDQAPEAPAKRTRDPALEDMRYEHLWIAYGAIWLIIFLLVFRTWKQGERTATELEDLKSRLAELESSNDSQ